MKNLLLFAGFAACMLTLNSCGAADKAEKTADKFFAHLISGKTDAAAAIVDPGLTMTKPELNQNLENLRRDGSNGVLRSAKKGMGFNTQMNNGTTTVKLPYNLTYQNGSRSVEVTLVDGEDGFKIVNVR